MNICKGQCSFEYPNIRADTCGDGKCNGVEGFRWLEDCTCGDCPKCVGNWPGIVNIKIAQ